MTATEPRTASSARIVERFGTYSRAFLVLAVFLVPVVVNRNSLDPFSLQKLEVLWVFGLLALSLHLIHARQRRSSMPQPRIFGATAVFLGACGVATGFSMAPRLSLFGLEGRDGGFIPLLIFVLIMVLIVALYWDRPERTRQVAWAISLGSFAVACYTIVQQAGFDPLTWYTPSGSQPQYPASTIGNSNFTGASLAIALPIGLYLVATSTSKRRPWLIFAVGLQALALWYTQSRGAFLAAVLGISVVGWICRDQVPRWARIVAVTGVATIAIGAVAVLWHPWSPAEPAVLKAKLASATSAEGRLSYWEGAWRVFLHHPLVGTGPETFYATYPPNRQAKVASDGSQSSLSDKPHNVFLEYAADTGALGLTTYLAVVGMALWFGIRRCRALAGHRRLLLAAFVGMLVAYLTQAAVSIDVPALAFTGWVAIGAIATLADPAVVRRRDQGSTPPPAVPLVGSAWRTFGLRVGVGVAFLGLFGLGMRVLRADVDAGIGRAARASYLNPLQPAYPLAEAVTALAVADAADDPAKKLPQLELARNRLERVLALQPDEGSVMQRLAETYTVWAASVDPERYADAIVWWQRSVRLDPTNVPLRQTFEYAKTQMQAHVADLDAAAAAAPPDPSLWLQAAKGHAALGEAALARTDLGRVLDLDPGNREASDILGTLPP